MNHRHREKIRDLYDDHHKDHTYMNDTRLMIDYFEWRLAQKIDGRVFVYYNCTSYDKYHIPIDNMDNIAIRGKVLFYQECMGKTFYSKLLTDPTWIEIAVEANKMIIFTCNYDFNKLIGIKLSGNEFYKFKMINANAWKYM